MNKKIEELYNKIDGLNNIIDLQTLEIAKLKNKIEEAIECIKENDYHYMNEYALERFRNNLLEILGDEENE